MAKQYVHYKDELVTINPALMPTDSVGTIMDILGEIAGQIKAATGSTNWYDAPEDSIKGIIDRLGVRPVRAATTANHGLSGLTAVDGVSIVDGDLVLAKNQTTGSQNGPWVAHSGAWTRPTDLSASGDFKSGLLVSVAQGTANAHTVWVLSTYANPIVPGTTSLTFDQVGGSGGSVDASTSAKGIGKVSVAPVSATSPIFVGDNDPRMAGTGAATTSAQGVVKVNTTPASAGDPIVVSENFPGLESYITGLQVVWNSTTSITVKSGAAYVPSLNRILNAPSDITPTLSLSASTFYFLYLWNNAGTPNIEVSTTPPGTAYKGSARVKGTPDNSRRYVGAFKTNSSSQVYRFYFDGRLYKYVPSGGIGAAPFILLNGGSAIVNTLVAGATVRVVIPAHVNLAHLLTWSSVGLGLNLDSSGNAQDFGGGTGWSHNMMPLNSDGSFYAYNETSGGLSYIYGAGYYEER